MQRIITMLRHGSRVLVAFLCLTGAATAQVTSLTMTSDSGDYVGLGQTYYFTPADGTFVIQGNYDNGVTLSFSNAGYSQF